MQNQLNTAIYQAICKHYVEQIELNMYMSFFKSEQLANEKKLHKLNYEFTQETKCIEIDTFKCSFKDAFDIKRKFDSLMPAKERFFYFSPAKPIAPITIKPIKAKRTYKKRIKPPVVKLPSISIWQNILLNFKSKNMKQFLSIALILLIGVTACEKQKPKPCEKNKPGLVLPKDKRLMQKPN